MEQRFENCKLIQDVTYKTVEGVPIGLDLYIPENTPFSKPPVIVYIHGGGWRNNDKNRFYLAPNLKQIFGEFLKEGFVGVSIDYRLATDKNKFPFNIEDCKDAVRWLHQNADSYGWDSKKIAVWGTSAGAHLAVLAGLTSDSDFAGDAGLCQYSSSFSCAISFFGPMDMNLKPADQRKQSNETMAYMLGSDTEEIRRVASPITYLTTQSIPVLMVHGTVDTTVSVEHARKMYQYGQKLGADVQLVEVEHAGHVFNAAEGKPIVPDNNEIARRTVEFIKQRLAI